MLPNKDPIDSGKGKDSVTGIAELLWPPESLAGGGTSPAEVGALLTTAVLFEAVVVAVGGNWPAVVWGGIPP